MIIKPEKSIYPKIVAIKITDNKIQVFYEKNSTFIEIVKSLWFTWRGKCWEIISDEKRGSVKNICAELGNHLLNAGFSIELDNKDFIQAAVHGDYTPMHRRWIQIDKAGFKVFWNGDLYDKVKAIPRAKYSPPGIIVPDTSWQALLDFSDKYDFRFTVKAQEKIHNLEKSVLHVTPALTKNKIYKEKNILESNRDIIEDLKD